MTVKFAEVTKRLAVAKLASEGKKIFLTRDHLNSEITMDSAKLFTFSIFTIS